MSYMDNFKDAAILINLVMKIFDSSKKLSIGKWFKKEGFWNYAVDENTLSNPGKYFEIIINRKQPSGLQTGYFSDDSNVNISHKNMYAFEVQKIIPGLFVFRKKKELLNSRRSQLLGLAWSFHNYLFWFGVTKNDIGFPKFLQLNFVGRTRHFFF